jgi:hypothetical protein
MFESIILKYVRSLFNKNIKIKKKKEGDKLLFCIKGGSFSQEEFPKSCLSLFSIL